jgi:hypothetical protein
MTFSRFSIKILKAKIFSLLLRNTEAFKIKSLLIISVSGISLLTFLKAMESRITVV